MTVSTTTNSVEFVGDGATTVFPYTFKIPLASHLHVYKITIASGVTVELAQGVDYTFTGIGADTGGTVTVAPAISSAFKICIKREIPYLQSMDIPTQSTFFANVLEDTLDLIVMMIQQVQALVSTTISGTRLFVLRSVAGTADVVTASTGQSIAAVLENDFYFIRPALSNTGPTTLAIDVLAALPVRTATGAALGADEFHPARYYGLLAVSNPPTELRIISEQ